MRTLRLALILAGTAVWIPYLVAKYVLLNPIPIGSTLAVHISCMTAALILRIVSWRRALREARRESPAGGG